MGRLRLALFTPTFCEQTGQKSHTKHTRLGYCLCSSPGVIPKKKWDSERLSFPQLGGGLCSGEVGLCICWCSSTAWLSFLPSAPRRGALEIHIRALAFLPIPVGWVLGTPRRLQCCLKWEPLGVARVTKNYPWLLSHYREHTELDIKGPKLLPPPLPFPNYPLWTSPPITSELKGPKPLLPPQPFPSFPPSTLASTESKIKGFKLLLPPLPFFNSPP